MILSYCTTEGKNKTGQDSDEIEIFTNLCFVIIIGNVPASDILLKYDFMVSKTRDPTS